MVVDGEWREVCKVLGVVDRAMRVGKEGALNSLSAKKEALNPFLNTVFVWLRNIFPRPDNRVPYSP